MTSLRELAERWKADSVGDDALQDYCAGLSDARGNCADELLSILDAEGDGGVLNGEVVGSLNVRRFRGSDSMVNHDFDYYGNLPDGIYNLYTHPVVPVGVPDGWVLVPKIATSAMRLAMAKADDESVERYGRMARAMLAAAPSAPQEKKVCTSNCDCVGPCKMGTSDGDDA